MSIQIIEHRKNTIESLLSCDPNHGVEFDLRSIQNIKNSLIVTHDPWTEGIPFVDWLNKFSEKNISGMMVVNTKEDQLEQKIFDDLAKKNIDNFVFLDTAFPTFVKYYQQGLGHKFMLRVSKYEPIESIMQFKDSVKWLWFDCFNCEPLSEAVFEKAKSENFKICLVSPELQGGSPDLIKNFKHLNSYITAVCTKFPAHWRAID